MDLTQTFSTVFSDFADPKKRIFVGYLALSVMIAFLWLLFVKRQSLRETFARVFDRKVFFSKSALADYQIFVINRAFTLFISPLLITQVAIATAIYFALHKQSFISSGVFVDANKALVVALFSVTLFVMDDLTKYLLHRWMHKWPPLWSIHKVHHSAETLTPITVYRVHPFEGVLYGLRSAFAQGLVLPVFIFAFGNTVDLYTVVGVNVLVFVFHVTGSNLRHSHINISYWPWLERVLISPAQHQLHHSTAERHFDKNFGAALAIWDWLFGSLHLSEQEEELTFGLPPEEASATNLLDIYLRPFSDTWRYIKRPAKKLFRLVRAPQKTPR
jgi:sterol desaturase/sphingolipid hydroxylase (fatty acid hydroxylase superfamily)